MNDLVCLQATWLTPLLAVASPVYWTSAYEVNGAANGHSLTKGFFRREAHVAFATGKLGFVCTCMYEYLLTCIQSYVPLKPARHRVIVTFYHHYFCFMIIFIIIFLIDNLISIITFSIISTIIIDYLFIIKITTPIHLERRVTEALQ